eukprot:COSAG01_NODE_198_length_22280_cov_21.529775_2_plen_64_part_00
MTDRGPVALKRRNAFHCNINGSQLLGVADALVSSGMLAAGYKSINIECGAAWALHPSPLCCAQ